MTKNIIKFMDEVRFEDNIVDALTCEIIGYGEGVVECVVLSEESDDEGFNWKYFTKENFEDIKNMSLKEIFKKF